MEIKERLDFELAGQEVSTINSYKETVNRIRRQWQGEEWEVGKLDQMSDIDNKSIQSKCLNTVYT